MRTVSRPADVFAPQTVRSILIVAPHPDDELFGCGLLIAEALRRGIAVAVVVLTDGQASHPASKRWPPRLLARLRRSETRRALLRLGARRASVRFFGWRDGALPDERWSRRLRQLIVATRADLVAVASPRDFHPDHQAAARLARGAARGSRIALYGYEVWSRVGTRRFERARDPAVARKRWAARAYRGQIGPYIKDDPDGFVLDHLALRDPTSSPERYWKIDERLRSGLRRPPPFRSAAPARSMSEAERTPGSGKRRG